MNGAHDMGGMHGFGPVEPEPNEPVFHSDWEKRAFALTMAMAMPGEWNIDMSRFARENRPPDDYLSKTYYQIWLAGLERLMLERGLVAQDEIAAGRVLHPVKPVERTLTPQRVAVTLGRGGPTERDATAPAKFKVGDRDILFVEHNGSQFIPLVGIMHGRFHVKRDQAGHESVVTNEGKPVKELSEFKAAVRQKMLAR